MLLEEAKYLLKREFIPMKISISNIHPKTLYTMRELCLLNKNKWEMLKRTLLYTTLPISKRELKLAYKIREL